MRRPQFIARQSARPSGLLGSLIAAIMVRETEHDNRQAIAALGVKSGDHVLDIGCGGGRSLELLLPLVGSGSVSGIDPSPLMVARAKARACHGRARENLLVQVASVAHLPFEAATFDAIMSVHTIYFWPDLGKAVEEVRRVLRPGGRFVLVFRTASNAQAGSFPGPIYRLRELPEIEAALACAGMETVHLKPEAGNGTPATLLAIKLPLA